jgi:hypothetical protein
MRVNANAPAHELSPGHLASLVGGGPPRVPRNLRQNSCATLPQLHRIVTPIGCVNRDTACCLARVRPRYETHREPATCRRDPVRHHVALDISVPLTERRRA